MTLSSSGRVTTWSLQRTARLFVLDNVSPLEEMNAQAANSGFQLQHARDKSLADVEQTRLQPRRFHRAERRAARLLIITSRRKLRSRRSRKKKETPVKSSSQTNRARSSKLLRHGKARLQSRQLGLALRRREETEFHAVTGSRA
jgi:hypothetical protein